MSFWQYILGIAILCGIPYIWSLIENAHLHNNVQWCIKTSTRELRGELFYIQKDLDLDDKYKLSEKDSSNIDILINCFSEDLKDRYFRDDVKKYKVDRTKCYYLYFRNFLLEHQYNIELRGNIMYEIERSTTDRYDEKCHLTDLAITYYKTFCILQSFYIKHKNLTNKQLAVFYDLNRAIETLDRGWYS